MADRSRSLSGVAIVAVAAALFGTLGPVTRWAYATGLEALAFIAWRSLIGMLATGGALAWRLRRPDRAVWPGIDRRARLALLAAAVGALLVNIGLFLAFQRLPVALALLAFYTYPALVAVVAVALGREVMDRWRGAALVLALLGMVGVVAGGSGGLGTAPTAVTSATGGFEAGSAVDPTGILLALLAAAGQTLFVTVAREGYRSVPADLAITLMLGFVAVVGAVATVILAGLVALLLPLAKLDALALLVFAGLFTAAIPTLLFLVGIRRLGGMRAGILMLIEPVVGVLLAGLLLAEPLGLIQLAGGLAILAAALLLERAPVAWPQGGRTAAPARGTSPDQGASARG